MKFMEATTMGIDLKVMASSFRERRGELLPTATLRFERDARLFCQLTPSSTPALARPLPAGLKIGVYEDEGLAWRETDRQGQPLTFTTPGDLRQLRLPDDLNPWNRAVLAFLLALPAESRVILFWC
jgi:hypothetical protein